jgi:ATP-dependent exoDNAse (exonuclease V) beta subunit
VISNKPEPPYFAYGKLVHKAAEIYVKEKGIKNIHEIASGLLSGNINEEFKNLLYVSVTRAKKCLYVFAIEETKMHKQCLYNLISNYKQKQNQ